MTEKLLARWAEIWQAFTEPHNFFYDKMDVISWVISTWWLLRLALGGSECLLKFINDSLTLRRQNDDKESYWHWISAAWNILKTPYKS